ncbi:Valine--tRNA ligase, mitochondrial [Scedosporium apiospermum]|uniref:Valine--tRNA ligase, mitochondrial n=1 Tax=Pseudallescheria apiosperma TaxID=563466 RepID=A0A084GF39_PSEDA|nr:Valine--tRNA ligase, mitochondrial [Scedosporium apiospermum]KEZ45951.1 Valine--tRNA ligase, mitochondrial [Scedosporium apiospermum]
MEAGKDAPNPAPAATKPKSAKQEKKEKAKEKAAAKAQAKLQQQQKEPSASKAAKEKPAKEVLPAWENKTPVGEKKELYPLDDEAHPHFKAYSPHAVESAWYSWWEKSGFFKPQGNATTRSDNTFVIPLPPPNVTGALHCGHALANSLQDTLIRWHRMRGFDTLWVPGCDHAGISTQSVVEKMLWRKEHKTRMDLGREAFTKLVWDWKDEYHQRINNAQRLMGGSMDWSREAFTMDKNLTAATMEAFVRLHDEGLIYRSNRLVNWCTQLNTALSGLEVENKEITGRTMLSVPGYEKKIEFGVLTHFQYPLEGSPDVKIEVATTRPETMLGDTGIAVHPEDKRYTHLVGKFARHPFTNRLLKIVADDYVDPEFGTGAVKLTPAHDNNDYALGQRHGLEFINILNDDGTLNENCGQFAGQRRFDARYTVVEELTKLGLFVKKEPNPMKIPLCEKSKDVIEPIMKPQWWMRMKEMGAAALEVVEQGKITIAPESARKSYTHWMSNINDWCLSRQLWWGHRIPAWKVTLEGDDPKKGEERWIAAKTEDEARSKAKEKFGTDKFTIEQDHDCLDTWFSSGLWPMGTLGWPNTENPDFKRFFPTSILETGWDILFFWVARMIMFSVKLTGEVPFKEVYCHSLIRDSEGRKMSKSLGNVIDPLDIINGIELEDLHAKLLQGNLAADEVAKATKYQKTAFPSGIPECGADALRYTLLSYCTGGGDISFDIKVMHGYRRFCNKIWQASKYVLLKLPPDFKRAKELDASKLSLPERWILHRMNTAVREANRALTAREFSKSTQVTYQFFYDELCDVFIENSKALLNDGDAESKNRVLQTLVTVLDTSLRLLHPFLPFITEELWQRVPRLEGNTIPSIMLAPYPEYDEKLNFESDAVDYEIGLKCAQGMRSLASEYGIRTGGRVFVKATTPESFEKAQAQQHSMQALSGKTIAEVNVVGPGGETPQGCAVSVVSSDLIVLLDVAERITDVDAEIKKVRTKLQKSQGAAQKQKELLGREGFDDKVSEVVKTQELKKLSDALAAAENYEKTIAEFEKLKISSA